MTAINGDAEQLIALSDAVLARAGGRLWAGYRATPAPARRSAD
ncbi:MAG: hypothetical protein WKF79_09585 [Nocardioides sp.]